MSLRRWLRRPAASPLLRLTMAVVSLCGLLVLLADLMLGLFPDRERQLLDQRRPVAESLAVQTAVLLREGQFELLADTLESAVRRVPGVQAAILRSAQGEVVTQAGAVAPAAPDDGGRDASTSRLLIVPLLADGRVWGRLELHFDNGSRAGGWLREPIVGMLLTISLLGTLIFGLYLRRALQHLDPSAVIPERVRNAFDVMSEGVVVLDAKGRVLLCNRAWQQLQPGDLGVGVGQRLSEQPGLAAALPAEPAQHPWMRTLDEGRAISALPLQVRAADGRELPLLVNTMPINDGDGAVRGCLVSFGDQSELHHAHAALKQAVVELEDSKAQVQRQNEELHRLATRDPLTGCLNRRAFNEAYGLLFEAARRDGTPLSCLILDIDHFKKVNDSHGHAVGDRVIQETARKLGDSARAGDLVCRYGGEEFVMALPGLDAEAALLVAERVRARVERECGPAVREVPDLRVTISLGVATLGEGIVQPSRMVELADDALYQAKRGGRNRAVLSGGGAQPAGVDAARQAATAEVPETAES